MFNALNHHLLLAKTFLYILLSCFLVVATSTNLTGQTIDKESYVYLKSAELLAGQNPDSAIRLITNQVLNNMQLNQVNDTILGFTYSVLGECYRIKNAYQVALNYYDSSEYYYFKSNHASGLGHVLHGKGNISLVNDEADKAIYYYKKAIPFRKLDSDKNNLAKTYSNMGIAYYKIAQFDSSMHYHNLTHQIRLETADSVGIANTLTNIGNILLFKAEDEKAIAYYHKARQYIDTNQPSRTNASLTNNIANILNRQGKTSEALTYFMEALPIFEMFGDQKSMAKIYNNVGLIHFDQNNIDESIQHHQEAMNLFTNLGNKAGIADTYFYLGRVYHHTNKPQKAKEYFLRSLRMERSMNDAGGIADCLHNLGVIHLDKQQNDSAYYYFNQAKEQYKEIGNKYGLALTQDNLAQLFYSQKKYQKAFEMAKQSLQTAESYSGINDMANAYQKMALSQEALGNYKLSLEYTKAYIKLNDSLFSAQKTEAILELESKYQLERKQQAIDLQEMQIARRDLEFKNKEKEIRIQKNIRNSVLITLLLMIILVYVLVRNLINRKALNNQLSKQQHYILHKNEELAQLNEELKVQQQQIVEQNKVLSEQNQRIEQSNQAWHEGVKYAAYIQQAVLPPKNKMNDFFAEYFVLYEPKEMVGGDFYWVHQAGNKTLIALGDCTGHGVPGGFLTMLSIAFLKEIVAVKNCSEPHRILDQLRVQIIESLQQSGDALDHTDGIDLSLVVVDKENKTLEYAGAKGKVIITGGTEPLILKGDRMPVSYSPKMRPFTSLTYHMQGNETVYLFTDGLVDQYNNKDEKFGLQRLLNFCIENQNTPLKQQSEVLFSRFQQWKNGFEQIDDATLIAFKIKLS